MTDSKDETTSALTPLETHLQLQAGRTTIGESGKRLLRDGTSQSSFADSAMPRPIPRLSLDSGVDDVSVSTSSSSMTKPVDRKISLTQSIESSYSTNNSSPRSPHTSLSTLSAMTLDSRSVSFETESEE